MFDTSSYIFSTLSLCSCIVLTLGLRCLIYSSRAAISFFFSCRHTDRGSKVNFYFVMTDICLRRIRLVFRCFPQHVLSAQLSNYPAGTEPEEFRGQERAYSKDLQRPK